MPLVPLALERQGADNLTIGIVSAAWAIGMLATASHIPRLAARFGAVPFILGLGRRRFGAHGRLHADRRPRRVVRADLPAWRGRRRAVGGERDLDERRRRGKAARPRHGRLFHPGRARHCPGPVRAAGGRRLRAGAVPDLRRTRPAGGVAAAALLEEGAADRARGRQRLHGCRRRGAARHAGRVRVRPGRAGRLQLPAGLCGRRRRLGGNRRALAVGFRDRQRRSCNGRSAGWPIISIGAPSWPAARWQAPSWWSCCRRCRRSRRRSSASSCCGAAFRSPSIRSAWRLLGQHFNGGDIARANTAFSMLYILGGLVGRPLTGAAMDAVGDPGLGWTLAVVLFHRRAWPPCWRSTGAADNPAGS